MLDLTQLEVCETKVVLKKYDGNLLPGQESTPVEEIVMVNGEIVEHIIKGNKVQCH